MSLAEKYPEEVKRIFAKYPPEHKRAAIMALLHLAQREEGYIDQSARQDIAQMLDITGTEVDSIIGFYTLYHDEKEGKYRIQVCNDLPCALRGSDEFLKDLCNHLGIKVGETTADGLISLEEVACVAACDCAPVFQTQGPDGIKYHTNMTIERTRELIAALKDSAQEGK